MSDAAGAEKFKLPERGQRACRHITGESRCEADRPWLGWSGEWATMSKLTTPEPLVQVACDLCGAPPGEPFLEKLGGYYCRCSRCGFVYSNPRAADPSIYNEQNNEHLSDDYIRKHYSAKHQRGFARRLRGFERYRKTGCLLEVGCSAGGFLFQARNLGWEPGGVEPVDAVARHGREQHGLKVLT